MTPLEMLSLAVDAARAAGDLLRAELHRPGGARGSDAHAPIDEEVERLIAARLTAATPFSFLGEETGARPGADPSHCWIVDPNDGTAAFLGGARGAAIAIALVRQGVPVLGVVHAYAAPDDDGDLITWAEGAGPVQRNGVPVPAALAGAALGRYDVVFVSGAADENPAENAALVAPGRFYPLASFAYRLALVAAGEGVAAVALAGPRSWDMAAGHALVRGAGGELLDERGQPVTYGPLGEGGVERCFGGAPAAARALAQRPWERVLQRAAPAAEGPYPRLRPAPGRLARDAARLRRAQGCLLGQLAGDALGALVEFESKQRILAAYPEGPQDLADGGTWDTLAGQPTDDSELALLLARSIVAEGAYAPGAALDAYIHWVRSRPFDIGNTTRLALDAADAGAPTREGRLQRAAAGASRVSQANGSLMRISPLGIFIAGRLAAPDGAAGREAASDSATAWAREDSGLTHPHPACREACAAFVAAIAAAVQGADAAGVHAAARAEAARGGDASIIEALDGAATSPPASYERNAGWVLIALQNAFYQLLHAPSLEAGLIATVREGGDTDTNAAIAGALLGAVHGRDAIPARWRRLVLTCRPLPEARALKPRPRELWPTDALLLAEALLLAGG